MADTLRVSFENPAKALKHGPIQRFRIRVRKNGTGANPTLRVEVYEGATLLATPIPTTSVASSASEGEVLEGYWNAQSLLERRGASVEGLVVVERGSGGAAVDIASLSWLAPQLLEDTTLVADQLNLAWNVSTLVPNTLTLRWHVISNLVIRIPDSRIFSVPPGRASAGEQAQSGERVLPTEPQSPKQLDVPTRTNRVLSTR